MIGSSYYTVEVEPALEVSRASLPLWLETGS